MTGLARGARVFVTGATGLVGSHVAALLRERGHPVRALHRPGADIAFLESVRCELVPGDVRAGVAELAEAMSECAAVVHTAAVTYVKLGWEQVRDVNAGGTERVLRAAAQAGARRAVHLSSVSVYGDPDPAPDEATPLTRPLGERELYARSKREAERVAAEVARATGLRVTILRASAVYGERDRLFMPQVASVFRLPMHVLLGDGNGTIPAVYAGNLASAVLAALAADGDPGNARVYDIGEDHPLTQIQLYRALADALGVPLRPVRLPRGLVLWGAALGDLFRIRILGAHELPLRRTARQAMGPNPYGSARLRADLGWEPRYDLGESLKRTAAWVAHEHAALGMPQPAASSSTDAKRLRPSVTHDR